MMNAHNDSNMSKKPGDRTATCVASRSHEANFNANDTVTTAFAHRLASIALRKIEDT